MSTFSLNTNTDVDPRSFASAGDVRAAFNKRREELQWLAFFITADEASAAECVTDACTLTENHNSVFEQWLATWARYATIRSAINQQIQKIKELSSRYQDDGCTHGTHARLSTELIQRVVEQTDWYTRSLDVTERATLIICGVEGHSISEAASLLGQSKATVMSAYCAALSALEAGPGAAQYRDLGVADRWF